jgi:hypothetical protein
MWMSFISRIVKIKWLLQGLGYMWTFIALHGVFRLIGFMLRQFELSWFIQLHPYYAIVLSGPIVVFVYDQCIVSTFNLGCDAALDRAI